MRKVLVLGVIAIGVCGTMSHGEDRLSEVLGILRKRGEVIGSLTCSYHLRSHAADEYVRAEAESSGRTIEEVVQQYTWESDSRFDETRSGWFRIEDTRVDLQGRPERRLLLSFDGKESWNLDYHLIGKPDDGFGPPTVVVGAPLSESYETAAKLKVILGHGALADSPSLMSRIARTGQAAVVGGDDVVQGRRCVTIRWPNESAGLKRRETAWLDPERGYSALRLSEEYQATDKSDWITTARWEASALARESVRMAAGPPLEYWYPTQVRATVISSKGVPMVEYEYRNIQVKINNDVLTNSYFRPVLEDGSNVRDHRTGRSIVHGGGPSARLKKILKRRIDEGKALTASIAPANVGEALPPPRSWAQHMHWLVMLFGFVGLSVAVVLRRRG